MDASRLGVNFEREIREQPQVWERLAASDKALQLARVLDGEIVLVGSGSSLFMAELGALALRRRRLKAHALAATEARLDHRAFEGQVVIAISQSGRSADLFAALDALSPRYLIALTNSADSPLAARAQLAIDVGAGPEIAVPASKSVSATAAILLRAASLLGGVTRRGARALEETAASIRAWLNGRKIKRLIEAAHDIARHRSVAVLGSDYGVPIANETALKLKEASYLHAEGFAAGEFRHGSIAMVDAASAVLGFIDADGLPVVERPIRELQASKTTCYTIGRPTLDDVPVLGPTVEDPYNTLAWLVTAQMLALHAGRARNVDSDAPRGLSKALVEE
jgi:glutamine---fructose-6-phosphate transaminase (isomerizing)